MDNENKFDGEVGITFSGKCSCCDVACLELKSVDFSSGKRYWYIKCKHAMACARMANKAKDDGTD